MNKTYSERYMELYKKMRHAFEDLDETERDYICWVNDCPTNKVPEEQESPAVRKYFAAEHELWKLEREESK